MSSRLLTVALAFLTAAAGVRAQDETRVEEWLDRADQAFAKGRWEPAAQYYGRAWGAEPGVLTTFLRLRECQRILGRYEEMDALDAKAAGIFTSGPESAASSLLRAEHLVFRGLEDRALEVLEGRGGVRSADLGVLALLGRIHRARGRAAESEAVYDRMVALAKERIVSEAPELTALAEAYRFFRKDGGIEHAEEVLIAAQKKDPAFVRAHLALARLYREEKYLPLDAREEARSALKIRPDDPDALLEQSLAEAAHMDTEDAGRSLARALKVNARHPGALAVRAEKRLSDALLDAAKADIDAILAVNPAHTGGLSARAVWHLLSGRRDAFEAGIAEILVRNPAEVAPFLLAGRVLSERRRWIEALAIVERAVKVDPGSIDAWTDLARWAYNVGDDQRGREALERADAVSVYSDVWRHNMNELLYGPQGLTRKYATITTAHFAMKLHRTQRTVLEPFLGDWAERSYRVLTAKYGFVPEGPIVLDVLQTHRDFSVRTLGLEGLGALGVCFGRLIIMFSPDGLPNRGRYSWPGTLHHEFTHVLTLQMSRGRVPRWLTEGLSTYEEKLAHPAWDRNMEQELVDALCNDEILGVLEFDSAFRGPRIGYAYYQGGLACEFMAGTWGFPKILDALRLYGEDRGTADVLREAFGTTPAEFDRRFLAFAREKVGKLGLLPRYSAAKMNDFRRRLEADPADRDALVGLALGHWRAGREVDAEEVAGRAVAAGVEDWRLQILRGQMAWRAGRKDKAIEFYEAAWGRGAVEFTSFMHGAAYAAEKGDHGRAKDLFLKARAAWPRCDDAEASPHLALARIYRGEEKLEDAMTEIRTFLDNSETEIGLRKEVAGWLEIRGDREGALRYIDEVIEVDVFDREAQVRAADLRIALSRPAEAERHLRVALELQPKPVEEAAIRVRLARVLRATGRGDAADLEIEKALELDPGSREAREATESRD